MHVQSWSRRLPWSIVAVAVALGLIGLLAIGRAEVLAGNDPTAVNRQAVWLVLGVTVMLAGSVPSYRLLSRFSYAGYALALGLLVLVFFFPPINGTHRWLRLGPIGVQPSELAKLAFIFALAHYLMYRTSFRRLGGLVMPGGLALAPAVLILREPDLGTAMVFVPLLFLMLFAAGARAADLAKLVVLALLVAPLLWSQMSREQRSRVTGLFEQNAPGQRPTADGYHLHQAKQTLALGGVWGSWLGGDAVEDRAVYHLPEARTDFVFCVIGERFGLWGTGGVLLLYGLLVWRGLGIAAATREPFGRLTAVGISGLFAVEVLINVPMTVGLAPITGLSLPLVSYGGSGLVVHALAVGLLLNIGLRPGYEVTREPFRFVDHPSAVNRPNAISAGSLVGRRAARW